MNFMFHTMLDAVGNILGVHYKSMKCDHDVSFHTVAYVHNLGEVNIFYVKKFFLLTAVQKLYLKNQTSFFRVMITNVLLFMKHSVVWS